MWSTARSVAAIALGLVAGAGALCSPTAVYAAACTVTVVTTDANGNDDPDVKPFTAACGPGEQNGGTEHYNPYNDTRSYFPPNTPGQPGYIPLEPLSPSGGGSSSSGHSGSTGGVGTANCTPAPAGGTKSRAATMVKPGSKPTCPTTSGSPSR